MPHYRPRIGDKITVTLPSERTRCEITNVVGDEAVIAQVLGFTTSQGHGIRKGDQIACRYRIGPMNEPQWFYITMEQMEQEIEDRNERRQREAKEAAAAPANEGF